MSVASYAPRTGEIVAQVEETSTHELAAVVQRAAAAAPVLAAASPAQRRDWLHGIADALEAHRDELTALADRETALGEQRLSGEVTRTAAQLRFYGDVAVEGSYLASPSTTPPGPRPGSSGSTAPWARSRSSAPATSRSRSASWATTPGRRSLPAARSWSRGTPRTSP